MNALIKRRSAGFNDKENGFAMKRLMILAALAGMALLGLVGGGATAQAVVPGTNGRILFTRSICASDTRPCWEVVAADANDSHETVLAGPYPKSVFDERLIANWSPDGSKAIFMADLGGGQEIWQVNADGTGLHALFTPPSGTGLDDGPAFTPDGKHIVFTRCCPEGFGYSLWMINSDGTGLKDVTKEPEVNGDGPSDVDPQVSPSGKRIAFQGQIDPLNGGLTSYYELFMNSNTPSPDTFPPASLSMTQL